MENKKKIIIIAVTIVLVILITLLTIKLIKIEKNKGKGYTSTSLIGKAGLEKQYEEQLKGTFLRAMMEVEKKRKKMEKLLKQMLWKKQYLYIIK